MDWYWWLLLGAAVIAVLIKIGVIEFGFFTMDDKNNKER
jgi:hypothetical protein